MMVPGMGVRMRNVMHLDGRIRRAEGYGSRVQGPLCSGVVGMVATVVMMLGLSLRLLGMGLLLLRLLLLLLLWLMLLRLWLVLLLRLVLLWLVLLHLLLLLKVRLVLLLAMMIVVRVMGLLRIDLRLFLWWRWRRRGGSLKRVEMIPVVVHVNIHRLSLNERRGRRRRLYWRGHWIWIGGHVEIVVVHVVIDVGWPFFLGIKFLSSDLLCCEEAATWAPWAPHGMLVARLVKIRLQRSI